MDGKLILFYKYVDIEYPKQIQKWQQKLCTQMNLKGRIIIAHEGINATIGGKSENINTYIEEMKNHNLFYDIDFKESWGNSDCFPKLKILIKDEIVKFGNKEISAKNSGEHLDPEDVQKLLNTNSKDLIIFDARNNFESNVGAFENAIKPNIRFFRELSSFIDENEQTFKDKKVLMYCTGGVRCEKASAYLKTKNIAKEVYQIKGGIHRYIEKYPNGYFRGKNYVFDARLTIKSNSDVLGKCFICNCPNDDYNNCLNAKCNKHFTACKNCLSKYRNTCSEICYNLVQENKVNVRPEFKKIDFTK